MPRLPFAIVDVFADQPLRGNPLAVVLGGEGVPDQVLRDVARELNQSETTFVLVPDAPGVTRRLRSFTAAGAEVMGAGHNTLGAWWWLVASGQEPAGDLTQAIGDQVLDVVATVRADGRVAIAQRQGQPEVGQAVDARAGLAAPLRLVPDDLLDGSAQVVSTGAPHLLLAATDVAAIDRARPDADALAAALADVSAEGCYLYAPPADGDADAYTRFFNPTVGLWEDPATGTAAGPLAWWLARRSPDAGAQRVVIDQGHTMGRPSRLEVDVVGDSVTLTGTGVLVAEGLLTLPMGA